MCAVATSFDTLESFSIAATQSRKLITVAARSANRCVWPASETRRVSERNADGYVSAA